MSDFEFREENTIEAVFSMEVGREMNDHNKLYNRYADDQHPISAITGLTEALAEGSSNLQAEISRAEAAEQALDAKIEAETTRAEGAESGLNTAISNETSARQQADTTLQNNITAEENRAKGVENGLRSDLTAETTARQDADTGLQNQITTNANDIDSIEDKIPSEASSSNKLTDKSYVDTADNNLQSQIDAISASSDVTDIVGTYAELQAYDTSTLTNDDIIKVLQDESQGGATTYYRWVVSGSSGSFVLIGSEGPYYTKAEADELYDEKQDEITATNKLDSDLVDDNGQTNKFVTADEKAQIFTNASNITALQDGKADKSTTLAGYGITNAYTKTEVDTALNSKADKSTTYTKTEVDTIATRKANVGLDNLNADGQMIIDSQNGTISNCVLEIPRNIKLTLENNILTYKQGTTAALVLPEYTTITYNFDLTYDFSNSSNGRYVVFSTPYQGGALYPTKIGAISSGTENPSTGNAGDRFFNVNDVRMYSRGLDSWNLSNICYPSCIVDVVNGVASFAKDSKGRDMIFNGMGFVGHHTFVYPNPKCGLISREFNDDGTLKSQIAVNSSLQIIEMDVSNKNIILQTNGNISRVRGFNEVDNYEDIIKAPFNLSYVKNRNRVYRVGSDSSTITGYDSINLLDFSYDGTTVTKFDTRQPYEGARDLLTDSLQADITTLTGYDSTQTQTLKNINGVLQWVTD